MALFKKKSPADDDDADYVAPEVLASLRRKRLWIILISLVAIAAVFVVLAARPLGRAIKGWQAERAAGQVDGLLANDDLKRAQGKVQDAMALSPMNPVAMRAAARFLSKAGANAEAVAFWQKIEPRLPLAAEDERLYAGALLGIGNVEGAQARLQKVWPDKNTGTPEDWSLGLSLALQRRDEAESIRLARKLVEDKNTLPAQQLRAASVLISTSSPKLRAAAWQTVQRLSEQKDAAGLDALILVARRCAAIKKSGEVVPTGSETPEWMLNPDKIAAAINAHPKAEARVRLFAMDLQLLADPSRNDELMAEALKKFSGSDPDLEALSAWLYSKGEYDKVVMLLTEELAVHRQSLFLQRLDAMAALGHWQAVRDTIQQSRFTMDRVLSELYIARCDEQLGSSTSAGHWQAALDAAGGDLRQLQTVADFATKSGRMEIAEAAGEALLAADPKARPSYGRLVQVYQGRRDLVKLNGVLQKMAGQWPDDDAVANDLAYSNLLLRREEASSTEVAGELFKKNPQSLPHRITLALARYRGANYQGGLSLLQNLTGETAPLTGRLRTVRAALLWALERKGEAAVALDSVKPEELFSEEKDLVAPVLESLK